MRNSVRANTHFITVQVLLSRIEISAALTVIAVITAATAATIFEF